MCLLIGSWLFQCLEAWLLIGTCLLIGTREYPNHPNQPNHPNHPKQPNRPNQPNQDHAKTILRPISAIKRPVLPSAVLARLVVVKWSFTCLNLLYFLFFIEKNHPISHLWMQKFFKGIYFFTLQPAIKIPACHLAKSRYLLVQYDEPSKLCVFNFLLNLFLFSRELFHCPTVSPVLNVNVFYLIQKHDEYL